MGGNSSKTVRNFNTDLKNTLSNSCSSSGSVNQSISGNKVTNSKCKNIKFTNTGSVFADCSSESVAGVVDKYSGELTEEQKAGIGINISDSDEVRKSKIKQYIENRCSSASEIHQEIDNNVIADSSQCDNLELANNADAISKCYIVAANNIMSDAFTSTQKKQAGMDPLASVASLGVVGLIAAAAYGMFFLKSGKGKIRLAAGVVALIGVILIVSGAITWNKANKDSTDPKTGQYMVGSGVCLLLIGVIVFMITRKKSPKSLKSPTKEDLTSLLGEIELDEFLPRSQTNNVTETQQLGRGKRGRPKKK